MSLRESIRLDRILASLAAVLLVIAVFLVFLFDIRYTLLEWMEIYSAAGFLLLSTLLVILYWRMNSIQEEQNRIEKGLGKLMYKLTQNEEEQTELLRAEYEPVVEVIGWRVTKTGAGVESETSDSRRRTESETPSEQDETESEIPSSGTTGTVEDSQESRVELKSDGTEKLIGDVEEGNERDLVKEDESHEEGTEVEEEKIEKLAETQEEVSNTESVVESAELSGEEISDTSENQGRGENPGESEVTMESQIDDDENFEDEDTDTEPDEDAGFDEDEQSGVVDEQTGEESPETNLEQAGEESTEPTDQADVHKDTDNEDEEDEELQSDGGISNRSGTDPEEEFRIILSNPGQGLARNLRIEFLIEVLEESGTADKSLKKEDKSELVVESHQSPLSPVEDGASWTSEDTGGVLRAGEAEVEFSASPGYTLKSGIAEEEVGFDRVIEELLEEDIEEIRIGFVLLYETLTEDERKQGISARSIDLDKMERLSHHPEPLRLAVEEGYEWDVENMMT